MYVLRCWAASSYVVRAFVTYLYPRFASLSETGESCPQLNFKPSLSVVTFVLTKSIIFRKLD